jgi:hypothetical protein
MRYQVGAEALERVPSMAHRPDGRFRSARTVPVGPTHAVGTAADAAACGIPARRSISWTRIGRRPCLSRSALAASAPCWPPAKGRGGLASGWLALASRADHPASMIGREVDSEHKQRP